MLRLGLGCAIESLYSTKKVKRKTMRVVVSSLQQKIKSGRIKNVFHVQSSNQLADVLTKKGVSKENILNTVKQGFVNVGRVSD